MKLEPSWILQIGSPAIAALAIIAVFVVGLLLDLLATFLQTSEVKLFYEHLARNRDWLDPLIADHKSYCKIDYEWFEISFRRGGRAIVGEPFLPADAQPVWWPSKLRPYERLWSFFASYVLVDSGSSQLSLMVDQYYLWRTARAITVSLLILGIEFLVRVRTVTSVLVLLAMWVTFPIALMITKAAYNRFCFTLFSLVYVTQDKRKAELPKLVSRKPDGRGDLPVKHDLSDWQSRAVDPEKTNYWVNQKIEKPSIRR